MTKQLQTTFNLIALLIISATAVNIFYGYVRLNLGSDDTQVMNTQSADDATTISQVVDYQVILDRNLFGALPDQAIETEVDALAKLESTTLKLTLLGTIAGNDNSARAIIMDDVKKAQNIYREEDTVQGAVVKKILRGRVILRHGDKDQMLSMKEDSGDGGAGNEPEEIEVPERAEREPAEVQPPEPEPVNDEAQSPEPEPVREEVQPPEPEPAGEEAQPPGPKPAGEEAQPSGPEPVIEEKAAAEEKPQITSLDRNNLQSSFENLQKLVNQDGVELSLAGEKANGVVIGAGSSSAFFNELGLKDGDVLHSINGKSIVNQNDSANLNHIMKSSSLINVQVTRDGKKKNITYTIR